MKRQVFWKSHAEHGYPTVDANLSGNVLIVGGGIGGVSLAYFLLSRGVKDITILEKGKIGHGATGHSAGMLVTEIEGESLDSLSKKIGFEHASLYWHAQGDMLKKIHKIIQEEHILCDAVSERLFIFSKYHTKDIDVDVELRHKMHLATKNYIGEQLLTQIQTEYYDTAEEIQSGISVNPLRLVQGLAEVVYKKGVRIFEHSEVQETHTGLFSNGYTLNFNTVVYAKDAYTDSADILRYNTTCAVTEVLPQHTLSMLHLKEYKMYIENQISSYHYMKMTKDGRILIGFGDRKTKEVTGHVPVIEQHVHNIKKYIKAVFPTEDIALEYVWTGTYGLHAHPLPFVSTKGNIHTFAGAGTQIATMVVAEVIADRIVGKQHVLNHIF